MHVLHILAMHWEKNLLKKRTVFTEYLIYVNQRFVFFDIAAIICKIAEYLSTLTIYGRIPIMC